MKIEITTQVSKVKVIDIKLPYYYKQDLSEGDGSYVIYGKIEEKTHFSIQESDGIYNNSSYVLEKHSYLSIKDSGLSDYFDDKYKSNKLEFEAVKLRCLSFINGV